MPFRSEVVTEDESIGAMPVRSELDAPVVRDFRGRAGETEPASVIKSGGSVIP